MLQRLRYSLTARVMLLFAATAIVIVIIMSATISLALRHQFDRNMRPHIAQYLTYLQKEIGVPPDIERARDLAQRLPVNIYITGPTINWSSTGLSLDVNKIDFRDHRHRKHSDTRRGWIQRGEYRYRTVLKARAGQHDVYYEIQRRAGPGIGRWIPPIALILMLTALYLCYRFVRWIFKPVQTIQQGVQQFAAGDLDHRIVLQRKDELGKLGDSVNRMAAELQKMLEAKRQLLLAISHELRSPITRAKVSTELLDDSKLKDEINKDLVEMETLVADILETERLNMQHSVLNKEPVSLSELLENVVAAHFSGDNLELKTPQQEHYVLADVARIKLLLVNLINNALQHSSPDSPPPEVSANIEDDILTFLVTDHGPGIPAEHIPHLTEPFYRVDLSRQRKTGGYGLGLYLCRVVAEAHGGKLDLESNVGKGTTVKVTIPLGSDI
ncbi:MAG: HAMP domain-containing histidine kinase [Gammaproteobacteria bacterium]|nr:HAMP domain-containing histidine kinase [Gammaproteobacteria bacterium]